jgi:hypothetical protein
VDQAHVKRSANIRPIWEYGLFMVQKGWLRRATPSRENPLGVG